METEWLEPWHAAVLLDVSVATVYRWLKVGALEGERRGRGWRISRAEVDRKCEERPSAYRVRATGLASVGNSPAPVPSEVGNWPASAPSERRGGRGRYRVRATGRPTRGRTPRPLGAVSPPPLSQDYNHGLEPMGRLRDLLVTVYQDGATELSRRDLLSAFGYQRLRKKLAEAATTFFEERGVGLRPALSTDVRPDGTVRLERLGEHFAPQSLARRLRGEIEGLAARRVRARYRDFLLFCGCASDGSEARDTLDAVFRAGDLRCDPPVGEASESTWVYLSPRSEPLDDYTELERDRVRVEDADGWLESNYTDWKSPQQRQVAKRFIEGERDTFGLLPTGSCRSLCFQLAASRLASDGLTLVVSPLLPQIADQTEVGTDRVTVLNSTVPADDRQQRLQALWEGEYSLLYVTPEQLGSESLLRILTDGRPVVRVAIDEAHCISERGHSFRVEYLLLRDALERLGRPPTLLLTATASPEVRDDVVVQLGLGERIDLTRDVVRDHFGRDELAPAVAQTAGPQEKYRALGDFIRRQEPGSHGIVYAQLASPTDGYDGESCAEIAEWIEDEDFGPAAVCHGELAGEARRESRVLLPGQEPRVTVATNAFGLGMDLPRVDWVVHFCMPTSLQEYCHGISRGGRGVGGDRGAPCSCLVLYDPRDRETAERLACGTVASADKIRLRFEQLLSGSGGQHGLRGPHEVLYDDSRQVLLLPFGPGAAQYAVGITHMLALADIGVLRRLPDSRHRLHTVHARFQVHREALTDDDRQRLEERQERRLAEARERLDEMERFCTEPTDEGRWGILDGLFGA